MPGSIPEKSVRWYRVKVPRETLAALNERSDMKAWLQTGGFLSVMMLTGGLSFHAWWIGNWWLMIGLLFLHGTVCAFLINGVHELVHGTVFRTKWLNPFFAHVFGFIGWINNRFFWLSHTEHHKYTLHPPADLEVTVPQYHTVGGWLKNAIINISAFDDVVTQFRFSLGKLRGKWEPIVLPEDAPERRRAVFNWSRFIVLGHLSIAAVSIYFGYWIIPVIVSLTPFYGGWLFLLCNSTQHAGLSEDVDDFRLNTRTIYLNPALRFLYWQMNYHIEHHMYAAVPCYNLGRLHQAIRHELPHCPNGLIEAWVEIGHIMYRQKRDPAYRFIPELPGPGTVGDGEAEAGVRRQETGDRRQKPRMSWPPH